MGPDLLGHVCRGDDFKGIGIGYEIEVDKGLGAPACSINDKAEIGQKFLRGWA